MKAGMPDFLLIGAAKAGTSALFRFLSEHPEVYASPIKEPGFFAFEGRPPDFRGPGDEVVRRTSVWEPGAYRELFSGRGEETVAGEATTAYLYLPGTAANIRRHQPGARLVAVLRDPVQRAHSAFLHLRRDGREPQADFATALDQEAERIEAGWEPLWHYTKAGFYGAQLERYHELFPREQILVHLYEDFRRDPAEVVARTFRFLGVDPEFTPDLNRRYNVSGQARWAWLQRLLIRNNVVKRTLRKVIGPRTRHLLWETILGLNTRLVSKRSLDPEAEDRLRRLFRDDVRRLEDLLDRDLASWRGE